MDFQQSFVLQMECLPSYTVERAHSWHVPNGKIPDAFDIIMENELFEKQID
ncbi:hypothetical protein [Shouchella tritolerans]|uniref:hypothetical protein n=1 Tax=Shouchella tritolerans TaxID=2979466 RepID=UPI0021E95B45|nr:hypothetical protein [Shouchella tritolerans]